MVLLVPRSDSTMLPSAPHPATGPPGCSEDPPIAAMSLSTRNTSMPAPDLRAATALRSATVLPVVFSGVSIVTAPRSWKVTPSLPQMVLASLNRLVQVVPVGDGSVGPVLRKTGCTSRSRATPGLAQVGGGGAERSARM